jgi:tetratricopeptide (TPR) repeat protein
VIVLVGVLALDIKEARAADRDQVRVEINGKLAVIDSLMATDPEAAVARSRSLFERFGDDPLYGWQVEGRLAAALLVAGRPGDALPHLENLVRVDPTDPVWHRNLAAALRQLNRRGRALTEYGLVVELAPADPTARLEYGQYLMEFRNYDLALHHLEEAHRLCGGCEEADRALANVHLARGDFASAVAPLRRLEDRGDSPDVRRSLWAALAHSGGDEELLERMETVGVADLNTESLGMLVEAEGRLGRAEHSLAFATGEAGGGNLPDDALFWGRVALNLLEVDEFTAGLAAADRAVALDPGSVVYRTNRVVLLQRLGREDEARSEWDEVLRLDPNLKQETPE